MLWKGVLSISFLAGLLAAQDGQQGARPGWPCVAGRAVDPSYLEISESTGGQLFLLQRNEVAHSTVIINAPHTHPSTVLRSIGNIAGDRDFEFAVDSGMHSILVMASLQCRKDVRIIRPSGAEATSASSTQFTDLQAGRIQTIDLPEPGKWKLRLSGTGLFVVSVLTNADVSLSRVVLSTPKDSTAGGLRKRLDATVAGQVSNVRFQVVDAAGDPIAALEAIEPEDASHAYRGALDPPAERFRIQVTGTDAGGWPFQRTHPVLFRAHER